MAISRTRTRINVKGGGKFQLRQISPTPSNTFLDAGYLKSTKIADEFAMADISDAHGDYIEYLPTGEKFIATIELLQTGIDEVNLQKNADGIYYDCYYSVLLANGNTQEWSIPLCKLKVGYVLDMKPGERILGMEMHALAPVGAFTRTPTAFNVVALVPYTLTEGAVANGAPTDTASTLATAVL